MDAELMSDRLRRQPTDVQSGDDYIGMDMHDRFTRMEGIKIIPGAKGGIPGEVKPRGAENWPVLGGKLGGKQMLAIDPRPLTSPSNIIAHFDQRNGGSNDAKHSRKTWSASRLKSGKNVHGRDGLNAD